MRLIALALVVCACACDKPSESASTTASSASAATSATAMPSASAMASASASAAASSMPSMPPPQASPADPADAKLAAFEKEVGQAIINAALGKTVDAKWIAKDPNQAIHKLTDPDDKKLLDVLGKDLALVNVEMELGQLAQPSPDEHHEINARAILLGDGTIRWGTVGSRQEKSQLQQPTPGLDKSAPSVVDAGSRLIKGLSGGCKMPWLAPSDVKDAPSTVQKEFTTDMSATTASCGEVAKVKGEWRSHIDDVRVLVKGNNHYGFLSSVFDIEQTTQRLVLSPIHAEVVQDDQLKK